MKTAQREKEGVKERLNRKKEKETEKKRKWENGAKEEKRRKLRKD